MALIGTKRKLSTAYHPQTDGQTEKINGTVEVYLCIYIEDLTDEWAKLLPTAEFAYNNTTHEATKMSPFFVLHGYNPRIIPNVTNKAVTPDLNKIFSDQQDTREQARALLVLAAE